MNPDEILEAKVRMWLEDPDKRTNDEDSKKGAGRPRGTKKGTVNYPPEFREVVMKAAEMNTSIEEVLALAGVTTNPLGWRKGFPPPGKLFLRIMAERDCSAEDLVASGMKMPVCVEQLLKIRALKPATAIDVKPANTEVERP